MQIEITTRHFNGSPNIREFIEKKLKKIKRFSDRSIRCHVIVSFEGGIYESEITLSLPREHIVVKNRDPELFKSIDGSLRKVIGKTKKVTDMRKEKPHLTREYY